MQKHFARSMDSLDGIFAFVDEAFETTSADPTLRYSVSFAVEELFTNMVKYNPTGPEEILLSIEPVDRGLEVRLVDYDSEPFDPNDAPRPRTDAPVADRPIGGLGLHLVKRLVDTLRYEYEDRRSTITFTRRVGAG